MLNNWYKKEKPFGGFAGFGGGATGLAFRGSIISDYESLLDPLGDGSGIALYRFNSNINDESGNYNGTAPAGTPGYTTSNQKLGSAAYNATTSDSVLLTGLKQPETAPWTAMWWWKRPNSSNLGINNRMVDFYEHTSTDGTTVVWENDNSWHFILRNLDGGETSAKLVGTGNDLNDNNWHHITVGATGTGNSQAAFVYVDGVEVNTNTQYNRSDSSESNGILVGTGYGGSISGIFDNWRFFNKALSGAEISTIYNGENV